MTAGRAVYRIKVSSMSWTLGPHKFTTLRRQVLAATRFFEDVGNHRWLRAAAREPGVVRTLEFGLPRMEGPVQSDYLPARLLALVARFGFDIAMSHYPVEPDPPRPRRRSATPAARTPRRHAFVTVGGGIPEDLDLPNRERMVDWMQRNR